MGTVLITGANRGIGLAMTRQLAERGEDVIAACRQASPELKDLGVRIEEDVDVTSDRAVGSLADRLGDTRLDVLINDAGLLIGTSLEVLDFDACRKQFEVNSLGPLRVTAMLRHHLADGAKVAIVTSRMGSIDDNTSGGSYGYRMSKAAVNMAGVSLAHDLAPQHVAVAIVHPGWVKTDMTRHTGHVEPEEAARGILARVDEVTMETSGTFWHANGEVLPW
ncbi:MAG: SDR family oxidoreductase [Myxococcota bacterium]